MHDSRARRAVQKKIAQFTCARSLMEKLGNVYMTCKTPELRTPDQYIKYLVVTKFRQSISKFDIFQIGSSLVKKKALY